MFGWQQNPQATLEELARSLKEQGADISAQGLEQRFTRQAAEFVKGVVEEALQRVVQLPGKLPIELLKRFAGVYLLDCTMLNLPEELVQEWPGTGEDGEANHAQLKLEVVFELSMGQLSGVSMMAGRTHDSRGPLANAPLGPGSLRIQDLGYWDLERMLEQDRRGEYWLSRYKHGTCLRTVAGEEFDLSGWLTSLEKQRITQAEERVALGREGQLKARLIAQRMPREVADRRRAALKARKLKQGRQPSQAQLVVCDWTLLVTNVPQEMLCADEALILYAARWQIELLFKLWKSHAQLGQSRSDKHWRRLCEIYCKLLGVIVQHWISLAGTWSNPRRSLVKAAHVVCEYAKTVALALGGKGSLVKALRLITEVMQRGCSQNPRRKRPNTWLTMLLYSLPWGL